MPNFVYLSQNWEKYTHPWRPGEKTLEFIEKYVKQSNSVCILGSTKEFRTICKSHDVSVDVYDTSLEMLKINDVRNTRETQHVKNWFDIQGNSYDLILGDLITFLLCKKDQGKLLELLRKNLSKNGKILLRTGGELENKSITEIQRYFEVPFNNQTYLSLLNMICYELVVGTFKDTAQIETILKRNSKDFYNYFIHDFMNLVPYGQEEYNRDYIANQGKSIYKKEFYLSYESLIEFMK